MSETLWRCECCGVLTTAKHDPCLTFTEVVSSGTADVVVGEVSDLGRFAELARSVPAPQWPEPPQADPAAGGGS